MKKEVGGIKNEVKGAKKEVEWTFEEKKLAEEEKLADKEMLEEEKILQEETLAKEEEDWYPAVFESVAEKKTVTKTRMLRRIHPYLEIVSSIPGTSGICLSVGLTKYPGLHVEDTLPKIHEEWQIEIEQEHAGPAEVTDKDHDWSVDTASKERKHLW